MSRTLAVRTNPTADIRILKAERDQYGVVQVSADVKSSSRPNEYHHTMIILNGAWLRFYCSCEAGAYGLLCNHVTRLYNYFVKHRRELLKEEDSLERARESVTDFGD